MAITGTAVRSCGSCRERRIQCDRKIPVCSQCSSSMRKCKGYGLRLSWPRTSDRKRAIMSDAVLRRHSKKGLQNVEYSFAHVTLLDVQLHYYLSSSADIIRPKFYVPMPWDPSETELEASELLRYCRYPLSNPIQVQADVAQVEVSASQSLTTFRHDPKALGRILMRISLANGTPSATAVYRSLLAISSLHRYGVQKQAFQLKISSLRALANASSSALGATEIIQHVAAGMLLCSFEVYQASCTSSQWSWYIAAVKEFLNAECLKPFARDLELTALVDWVYYHDVMLDFTLRHWRGNVFGYPLKFTDAGKFLLTPVRTNSMAVLAKEQSYHTESSMLNILQLLAELNGAILARSFDTASIQDKDRYRGYVQVLEWRIRNVAIENENSDSDSDVTNASMVELYQLATLVYLNRVTGNLLCQEQRTQQHLSKAFTLFTKMDSCERQFPLLIIGCEAQTDDERLIVLELIARTEKKSSSRSLNHIKLLVQAFWAQDDLADGSLDYSRKLSQVISCCVIIPSLV